MKMISGSMDDMWKQYDPEKGDVLACTNGRARNYARVPKTREKFDDFFRTCCEKVTSVAPPKDNPKNKCMMKLFKQPASPVIKTSAVVPDITGAELLAKQRCDDSGMVWQSGSCGGKTSSPLPVELRCHGIDSPASCNADKECKWTPGTCTDTIF